MSDKWDFRTHGCWYSICLMVNTSKKIFVMLNRCVPGLSGRAFTTGPGMFPPDTVRELHSSNSQIVSLMLSCSRLAVSLNPKILRSRCFSLWHQILRLSVSQLSVINKCDTPAALCCKSAAVRIRHFQFVVTVSTNSSKNVVLFL